MYIFPHSHSKKSFLAVVDNYESTQNGKDRDCDSYTNIKGSKYRNQQLLKLRSKAVQALKFKKIKVNFSKRKKESTTKEDKSSPDTEVTSQTVYNHC